jgi:hypothetical protein
VFFFTECTLAEVVHSLLRVGFCKAPSVYSEIPVQLNLGLRAHIRQCFAVCSSLDKTGCISESAAASPFARPAVI